MSAWLYRLGSFFSALPVSNLLVFTLLIWMVFFLILFANPKNKLNQWCFIGGITFSVGALKEYLFYALDPVLIARGMLTPPVSERVYSLLSSVFYLLSIPSVMMFSFYFHKMEKNTARFRTFRVAVWLPALYLAFIFPPAKTHALQSSPIFCLTIALYNWLGGIIATSVLISALKQDRLSSQYHQRRLAVVSILLPLWVWLIAAFPYHALGIENLDKIWQINVPVVFFILAFCLYHAFREGIWGIRLRRETYDWSGGSSSLLQRNSQYLAHALKNDLNKIEWCASVMASSSPENHESEIIQSSVAHLRQLINRTRTYTDQIVLMPESCDVSLLFKQVIQSATPPAGCTLSIDVCDAEPLFCDPAHLREVLENLISNAFDAVGSGGRVTLSYRVVPRQHKAVLSVSDNGCGMSAEEKKHIFEPYHSTKETGQNFGLGLYYCYNVMNSHNGSIQVESLPGRGSTFSLLFPLQKKRPTR